MKRDNVIAVDGPGGVGKGTLCALIAQKYHFDYLDSGALYRLSALEICRKNLQKAPLTEQLDAIAQMHIQFVSKEKNAMQVLLNGAVVDEALRVEETGILASKIAVIPEVRRLLLDVQRNFVKDTPLVADGRDMGTTVFPNAILKLFLDASIQIRAERRYKQLKLQGENVTLANLEKSIAERDERDRNRQVSPLKPALDAVIIDTSHLNVKQVFEQIDKLVQTYFI